MLAVAGGLVVAVPLGVRVGRLRIVPPALRPGGQLVRPGSSSPPRAASAAAALRSAGGASVSPRVCGPVCGLLRVLVGVSSLGAGPPISSMRGFTRRRPPAVTATIAVAPSPAVAPAFAAATLRLRGGPAAVGGMRPPVVLLAAPVLETPLAVADGARGAPRLSSPGCILVAAEGRRPRRRPAAAIPVVALVPAIACCVPRALVLPVRAPVPVLAVVSLVSVLLHLHGLVVLALVVD
mmetsp:Transcript_70914/g.195865  ORF Transcript_70914/g.195865 Transcript_70914/m.195865 type:complete len:237 (-) Transcript_70914:251-961(-)